MRYKYVNGHPVPYDTPCPADCWHENTGRQHVPYLWYQAPGTNWLPQFRPEHDRDLMRATGWEPVDQ